MHNVSWYTKAQKIAPKNGRPYNQLAILALSTVNDADSIGLDYWWFVSQQMY